MAVENTINLLKWWYPTGLDVTVSHDPCDLPTGRYDITVTMPECEGIGCLKARTPLQNFVNLRMMGNQKKSQFVWRDDNYTDYSNYEVDGEIMLASMKYLGSDQYLYDRPDTWECTWKGVELASVGRNDYQSLMTLENHAWFLKNMSTSTWPVSPLTEGYNCGVPFTYPQFAFNIEAWMFQRVFSPAYGSDWVGALFAKGNTDLAKSWAACRFWYETHPFGNARVIRFAKETPAQAIAEKYPQYFPGGMAAAGNPWEGQIDIADFDTTLLQNPVTSADGGFNATGYMITSPPPSYNR